MFRGCIRSIHYTPARLSILETSKNVLNKANKKTGEFLASTMDTAEKVAEKTSETISPETIKQTSHKVNKNTGKVLAEGMDQVEKTFPNVNAANPHPHHKKRVSDNTKGYHNLQDKGSKVESEQNRPEDGL